MEYGSAFAHGAYLGPDYTADYLRRSSNLVWQSYDGPASDAARSARDPGGGCDFRHARALTCRKHTRRRGEDAAPGRRAPARGHYAYALAADKYVTSTRQC